MGNDARADQEKPLVTNACPDCGAQWPDSYPVSWSGGGIGNYLEVHYHCKKCGTRYRLVTKNQVTTKEIIKPGGEKKHDE